MAQAPAPATTSRSLPERAQTFFQEVKAEAKKVNWPTRDELRESTMVVIVTVAIISLFITVIDRVVGFLITRIL
ncbi:MAG: preprotein translocase subunit SecE [Candidatus Eisenbacteria bacterium]|nr:preprotein translocase subunit SecE [Candidatus Eisenbacteria bacterium]MCC7141885.1 preprotein translocase subunit SecE [Candidatus Eisenbacteria bacterium]